MLLIVGICFLIFNFGSANRNYCDHLGTLLYEDLGCTPTYKTGQECPVSYNCQLEAKDNSCTFRGRSISVGAGLNNNDTIANCKTGCICTNSSKFECARVNCFDYYKQNFKCIEEDCSDQVDPYLVDKQECYRKDRLGECCGVGQICPTTENPLYKCLIDTDKILEGQFFKERFCSRCVCSKDYNGKIEPPFCERLQCLAQIFFGKQVANFCAPYYEFFGNPTLLCCPYDWVCPTSADKSLPPNPKISSDSGLTCKFGSKLLNLGERLQSTIKGYGNTRRKVQCECILPPLLTCSEYNN